MAGLLDSGGYDPTAGYGSLLTPEMQQQIKQRQLLGLAQGLLQTSGPSRTPVGFGQVVGGGLQGMTSGADEGVRQALQPLLLQSQLRKDSLQKLQPGETMYDVNTGKPAIGSNIFGAPIASGGQSPQDFASSLSPIDPLKQFMTQNPPPPVQNGQAANPANLHGDDFLKQMPQSMADQVKALAEGRMQFPGGFALKSPYWQQMIQAVSQYDPNFDAVNYNSRAKTRADFTSGKSAQNITALNTAMGHLSSLSDSYDKLNNTDYPTYNSAINWANKNLGGTQTQGNMAAVDTEANAVANEMAKVFRSTGMSEKDIQEWRKNLNTSSTPAQTDATKKAAIELMNSRLDAIGQQYNQGMGTSKQGIELLSPKAQEAYKKLTGNTPSPTNATGNLAADNARNAAPPQNRVSGQVYPTPRGPMKWTGTGWLPQN